MVPISRRKRVLFLALTGLLTFVTLECILRVAILRADLRNERAFRELDGRAVSEGSEIDFGGMVRASENPRLIYELIPNLRVRFMGEALHTNPQGIRGPERPVVAAPGTLRIVGLGDSFMFGWGVSVEESYLARLEARLDQEHPSVEWEVINLGVPGYNTAMEVEALEVKGLAHDPDVVILDFVANDLDLPNFLHDRKRSLTAPCCLLFETLRTRGQRLGSTDPGFMAAPFNQLTGGFERDPDRVPARYRDMVGMDSFRRSMATFAALAEERDFVPIVMTLWAPEEIRAVWEAEGLTVIRSDRLMRAHAVEEADREALRRSLFISDYDRHPSALGHRLISEALYETLAEQGLWSRLAGESTRPLAR